MEDELVTFAQNKISLDRLAGVTFDLLVTDPKHNYYIIFYPLTLGFLIRKASDPLLSGATIICPVNKLKSIKYIRVTKEKYVNELVTDYLLGYQQYYRTEHADRFNR